MSWVSIPFRQLHRTTAIRLENRVKPAQLSEIRRHHREYISGWLLNGELT